MSSMVKVTRTEYHTFLNNMVEAFGEENVVDHSYAFGCDVPHVTISVYDITIAALHLELVAENSCRKFFTPTYVVDSGYISWRNEDDPVQSEKPTKRDTVSPFATTLHDMKTAIPKPRLLPMKSIDSQYFDVQLAAARSSVGNSLTSVLNHDRVDILNTCFIYKQQIIAQIFYYCPSENVVERRCLTSPVFTLFSYLKS